MSIAVLLGTSRKGNKSEFIAHIISSVLAKNPEVSTELINLADYPLPLFEERIEEMETLPQNWIQLEQKLTNPDGLIIVTPEYKGGMPAALKNVIDYLKPQVFYRKPIGVVTVSSGGFGGVNCLSQLRLTISALGGLPIPEKLCISHVNQLIDNPELITDLESKSIQFVENMIYYVNRLK